MKTMSMLGVLATTALVPLCGQNRFDTTLPQTLIAVSPDKAEYDSIAHPATSLPGSIISVYGAKEEQKETQRGCARLGYGNYGNLDARARYLFSLSERDKLGFRFGMDGMNGKLDLPNSTEDWDSHYYKTRAGVDYTHQFDKINMDIAGNFRLSNFNYLPSFELSHQRFTSGGVHFGVKSASDVFPLDFKAETNLLFYQRGHNLLDGRDKALTESLIRTKADVTGNLSATQIIGFAAEMNNKFYNNKAFENNTALLLNPYYEWKGDKGSLHLGVNADFAFGFGKKFRISPDVTAKYIFSKSYVVYGEATGGKVINNFSQLEENNPYGLLSSTVGDSYRQVDLKGGLKASPFSGFWFNIYVGYQSFKDDLYHIYSPAKGFDYASTHFALSDDHNTNAGLQLYYTYKDLFSFLIDGQAFAWETDAEDALALKPEFTIDTQIKVRPLTALHITVGHQYARRNEAWLHRIDPVNNLYLSANYNFYKGISIYGRVDNLFDQEYSYYLEQPGKGVNLVGGVGFRF